MTSSPTEAGQTRRQLLSRIGAVAGSAALYQAMTSLGHAAGSDFNGPPVLTGARPGTSVIVLGAGLAGMLAAYELRRAGYSVRILEYQDRAGGRNVSLHGGDRFTELGGITQTIGFAPGNYLNPGPWRIPYHHQALLHYCRAFGVALEPFIQLNHNAYLHSSTAFGGVPQRYRTIDADYGGYTSELLAKAIGQHRLDQVLTADEQHHMLAALKSCGMLDASYDYKKGMISSERRGFARPQGGGLDGAPVPSDPLPRDEIMRSGLWRAIASNASLDHQTTMFQPVGGMDQIGRGFARQVRDLITMQAKVTSIHQDQSGVTISYLDEADAGASRTARADYCVCTIPLSILSQLDLQVGGAMKAAIGAVPYLSSVKVGLEFNRRFWEEDEQIYGGISMTDLPITQISYPSHGFFSGGKAVLLGGYLYEDSNAFRFTGMSPAERIEAALSFGEQIHPQYRREFSSGAAVAWSRVPWTLGCCAMWSEQARREHYRALCEIDGRVVLAGEHASWFGCWQEGAILSSLDAVTRLHQRMVGSA